MSESILPESILPVETLKPSHQINTKITQVLPHPVPQSPNAGPNPLPSSKFCTEGDLNRWVKCSILYSNLMNKTLIYIHQGCMLTSRSRNTWEHIWFPCSDTKVSCSEGIYQNVGVIKAVSWYLVTWLHENL